MLLDSVKHTIEKENLFDMGDRVLVALSGGPDSVCLLHCLKKIEDNYKLKIFAAHLNHKIRGIEAQKDAMYAAKLCDSLEVPFFVKAVDVPLYAMERKLTLEEAARNVRYQMLFEIKEKIGADKVAIAHNLDDQAETVLMRLLRGTGINGLKGMDYKRKDGIVRPLLDVLKSQIEEYCIENNLDPRLDKTNLETDYTRNKIRINLIPFIENGYAQNIKMILSRMANILREDNDFLEREAKTLFLKDSFFSEEMVRIHGDDLKFLHPALQKRIIRYSITHILKSLEGIESVHIEDVLNLVYNPKKQAVINLPKGLLVYKRPEGLIFTTKTISYNTNGFCYEVVPGESISIPEINWVIETKVMSKEKCMMLPTGNLTKAFDIEKIKGNIVVRTRQDGDRMRPMGLGGTKKLKDIFIDMKIPREERDETPLICDQESIIWLVGHKISEDYKIDENTKKVLRICCKEQS